MEGKKISWDELPCVEYKVTETAIKQLCREMNTRRKELQEQRSLSDKLPMVTRTNLESWNLIRRSGAEYIASNAFVLLSSDYFPFSRTQCAVFKGTDRSVFLDKREFTGPLYTQIEEAERFVLRNIRLGARIDGLVRKESYELPIDAIREMIINAHCHRNLTDESCVQVAIYDDRLEVTSPGGLYNGLTFEEALEGRSKLRNRAIANVFRQIGFIEAWGTGLQRIRSAAKEYGLREPEFIEMPESFRVNLFRNTTTAEIADDASVKHRSNIGQTSVKHRSNKGVELNDTQQKILNQLLSDDQMTASALAAQIGISKRNIETNLSKLKAAGLLIRHGGSRGGHWEITGM